MSRLTRPSPSMVVACLALVIALGGTATAAVIITSTSQIKDGAIKRPDLAQNAINTSRIQDGSVTLKDLAKDAQGAGPTAYEAFRAGGPEGVAAGTESTVATLKNLPAGAYAIFAKTVVTAPSDDGLIGQGESVGVTCTLDTKGDTDLSFSPIGGPGSSTPAHVNLQLTRTFGSSGGEASLKCTVPQAPWRASNTSIIAIRLGSAPVRTNVDG